MRFLIHPKDRLEDWPEVQGAYISGLENRVFPTRVELEGNLLSCRHQTQESGKLNVVWPISGHGRPVIRTTSLLVREEPYLLAVELARGKISQVREQQGIWEAANMAIPDDFRTLVREAFELFARASCEQDRPEYASEIAYDAIQHAMHAAGILTRSYASQRLRVRKRRSRQLPALLGCDLGDQPISGPDGELVRGAFTAVGAPLDWRLIEPTEGDYHWDAFDEQVEWAKTNKMIIRGGPLLDLSAGGLPQWVSQWKDDFLNLQSFVCDFVETVVSRYLGRIRTWEVSARANTGGGLSLSEEARLELSARTLDVVKRVDEESQLLVRIDQPWGEYQAEGRHQLSPFEFVDTLIRTGVGLAAVNLEVAVGYTRPSSGIRDLLEFSRFIDSWSLLGIPLHVTLACPSQIGDDPNARRDVRVGDDAWSEAAQAEWIETYLPLLMAKQAVVGIFWSQLDDRSGHLYPNTGLLRSDGTAKPALESIARYRQAYWDDQACTEESH